MPQRTNRRVLLRTLPGWIVVTALVSCGAPAAVTPAPDASAQLPVPEEGVRPRTPPTEPMIHPEPEAEEAAEVLPTRRWSEVTLAGMTLRQKVGQLIMPWVLGDYAPEGTTSHERVLRYIEEQEIGGLIMSVGSPTEVAAKLNDFQTHSRFPLLVAADLETGAGFRMRGAVQMPGTIELGGATDFPSLMAVGASGDTALAYEMGRVTAVEARAVGIHVPFAPVLDVNNNPDNPIINVRSFGADPALVARLGAAFVRGIQENGSIATGKHFPGHGDTGTDSHLALPLIPYDRARMDSVELRPFQAAIDAGMGAVMTAHISVPGISGGDRAPSTLNAAVLTDLLREDMGFDGLLFTDAMDMSAIARQYSAEEAAVLAVEAGADVILMPASPARAVDGIVAAVESGRISEQRIDASVRRLLETKEDMGLDRNRRVPLEDVYETVGIPSHTEWAAEVAERSITVLRNGRNLLPLRGTRTARVMSVSFRRASDVLAGRYFNRRLRATYPRLSTAELDRDRSPTIYQGLLREARTQALVIVSTYVTAVSYQGSMALPDEVVEFIEGLDEIGVPHIVVSFGNPYLLTSFPDVQAYMLAWSGSEASQTAAARALFGEFDITGRTPTSVPPLFDIGAGLTIDQRRSANGGR
ncbi:MAG TPA: glycoside hydrolase family 3 protein [Gemmatimonadetes bacterium]|nr:glycoside hydrolase family 3 protein [Gemmatimonadota bacterium]